MSDWADFQVRRKTEKALGISTEKTTITKGYEATVVYSPASQKWKHGSPKLVKRRGRKSS